MNADDEHLLRGRVYGHDHDDPLPGPLPDHTYAALIGGPLDGHLLDIKYGLAAGGSRRGRGPVHRAGVVAWWPGAVRPAPR